MTRKKSKFSKNHLNFIKLAFEQAKINLGSTGENPSVGCVIVKNDTVISSGYTSKKGRPHAEHNALNKKEDFKGATMYVTLEPCSHYGLTPPCVNIIKRKGISRVFYSVKDCDIRSKGKSKNIFKTKKIKSINNIMNSFGNDFYKSYYLSHSTKLPYTDAKIALSFDYKSIRKRKRWITNIYSRKLTQFLRTKYDCIISTSKSINKDNSKLNCRIDGLEASSPDLIIIDRYLKLKKNLSIYNQNKRKIIIFTLSQNKEKIDFFRKKGIKLIFLTSLKTKTDFNIFFHHLKKLNYSRLFFECGITLLSFLIKNGFINNLYIFRSNEKLKKLGLNNVSCRLLKNIRLKNKIKVNLKGDSLYKAKLKNV